MAAVGLAFGWGIYVNHVFTAVWLGDTAWSWLSPQSHRQRWVWVTGLLHAFMVFIAVNGLMIFKGGATRWVSGAAVMALLVWWLGTLAVRRGADQRRLLATSPDESAHP